MSKRATNGFIKIEHELMRCPAWLALSIASTVLLLEVWSKHNGRNNGEITYSCREARERFGFGLTRAVASFAELQDKGFIVAMRRGSFNTKTGEHRGTSWRLTMEPFDGKPPTRDYLAWRPSDA